MTRLISTLFVLIPTLALAGAAAAEEAPNISPKEVSALQSQANPPILLDVRTPGEFAAGHVPGSINIPHTELAGRLSDVSTENGVVVFCMKGPRARLAEQTLSEAGVEKVLHTDGGFSAWSAAGLPVKTGAR